MKQLLSCEFHSTSEEVGFVDELLPKKNFRHSADVFKLQVREQQIRDDIKNEVPMAYKGGLSMGWIMKRFQQRKKSW